MPYTPLNLPALIDVRVLRASCTTANRTIVLPLSEFRSAREQTRLFSYFYDIMKKITIIVFVLYSLCSFSQHNFRLLNESHYLLYEIENNGVKRKIEEKSSQLIGKGEYCMSYNAIYGYSNRDSEYKYALKKDRIKGCKKCKKPALFKIEYIDSEKLITNFKDSKWYWKRIVKGSKIDSLSAFKFDEHSGIYSLEDYPYKLNTIDYKVLKFDNYELKTPKSWNDTILMGIDSYVTGIAVDDSLMIYSDWGWYSNKLDESENDYVPLLVESKNYEKTLKFKKENNWERELIKCDVCDTFDLSNYYKSKVYYYNLNGFRTKVVVPKVAGKGYTGIYIFDVMKRGSYGIPQEYVAFNIVGYDLPPEIQKQLLESLSTLKILKKWHPK